jgi:hypothetical protein
MSVILSGVFGIQKNLRVEQIMVEFWTLCRHLFGEHRENEG